jgi:hypothetical protein
MGRVRFGPFMREMRHFPTFVRLGWGQTTLTAMDANTINVGTSHRPWNMVQKDTEQNDADQKNVPMKSCICNTVLVIFSRMTTIRNG